MWAVVLPVAFICGVSRGALLVVWHRAFLSGDEDVIFERHDLPAAEEGLFDEGQRPVFEPFVFVNF